MRFTDVSFQERPLNTLMEEVLITTDFSSMRIFTVDYLCRRLVERRCACRNNTPEGGNAAPPEKIFGLLKKVKKALYTEDGFVYGREAFRKFREDSAYEAYIPLCKRNSCFGMIVLASDNKYWQGEKELENPEFKERIQRIARVMVEEDEAALRKESLYQITYMLCGIVDRKEPYLISRLFNVAYWGIRIARAMGVSEEDVEKLQLAILMHDLGKIYIDEDILNKRGSLTDNEYETMKQRVVYSHEIAKKLSEIYEVDDLPEIILNYQERIDGRGYPSGKKGEEIPLLSRILGTAKAIAAMLSSSPHRRAISPDEAAFELRRNAGRQFDKRVVAATVALLSEGAVGGDCFSSIGTYATLHIRLRDPAGVRALPGSEAWINANINVWGNVRRAGDDYVFTPAKQMPVLDPERIKSCSLYISIDEKVYRYIPQIMESTGDRVVFSRLDMIKDEGSFAIRWKLNGYFVSASGNACEIFVTMIGGDFADFYVYTEDMPEAFEQGLIRIDFEDGRKAALPGVVIFSGKAGDKTHYRLKFTGLKESDRKLIFSEIFRKQVTGRSLFREGRH